MDIDVDVVVVGAGVIGLAGAWRLAEAGYHVTLLDDGGPAAGHVAAGMLAPITEAEFGEQPLLALQRAAIERFPTFVADLEQSGPAVGLRREGTLLVGLTADDRTEITRMTAFRSGLGLPSHDLDGPAIRTLEPYLNRRANAAVFAPDDLSVDNRALLASLRSNTDQVGVRTLAVGATGVLLDRGRVLGVRLSDGRHLRCGTVVLAGGARSATLDGIPAGEQPPMVPVSGHVLRLAPPERRPSPTLLTHTVRALVDSHPVYLVPRESGEIVVGATSERRGFDRTVQVNAVRTLLRDAHEVLPVIDELTLAEVSVGLRPGSPDNGPMVGWSRLPNLFVATGHYRNGILLSAITADEIVTALDGGPPSPFFAPFSPHRFTTEESS